MTKKCPASISQICVKVQLLITCGILVCLFLTGLAPTEAAPEWREKLSQLWAWMRVTSEEHSMFLLLAIAILPGLGLPSSPFLVLCGALTEKTGSTAWACLLTAFALWVNALWMFLFAAYPGRRIIEGILQRMSKKLPDLPQMQGVRLAIILRVTPGVPLTVQNYLLGISGISLKNYLLVSIPVMGLWAVGFVVFGEGLLEGDSKMIIVGVGLLVGFSLTARMIAKRHGLKKPIHNG